MNNDIKTNENLNNATNVPTVFSNEVFSWESYAGKNRTYFFSVKEDKNAELYITVKELKFNPDGTKEVHRIIVFEKDFLSFSQGFQNVMSFVKGRKPTSLHQKPRYIPEPKVETSDYTPLIIPES